MVKKVLVFCFAGLLSFGAAAQQRKAAIQHEVHLSASGPAVGYVYSDAYGSLYNWGTDLYSLYEPGERVDAGPVFSIGYTYAFRRWLKPGVEASWSILWADKSQPRAWGNGNVDRFCQRYYAVMPLVHFMALDNPHFKIYGKLAAGGQLSVGDFEKTTLRPAWQIVPVGLQWGGEKIYGLAEMGYGNVFLIRCGIGIRW